MGEDEADNSGTDKGARMAKRRDRRSTIDDRQFASSDLLLPSSNVNRPSADAVGLGAWLASTSDTDAVDEMGLVEEMLELVDKEMTLEDRMDLSIFLYGVHEVMERMFTGEHWIVVDEGMYAPRVMHDENGEKLLVVGSVETGFKVSMKEVKGIVQELRNDEKVLREKYVRGSAVARKLSYRKALRDFLYEVKRVDPKGLKRNILRGMLIRQSVFEEGMSDAERERQIELLVTYLVNIQTVSPETTFYLGEEAKAYEDMIQRVLSAHDAEGFVRIGNPTESIVIVVDLPTSEFLEGIPADIEAIQPQGLPDWSVLLHPLLEGIAFTNPNTGVFDFEILDITQLESLREGRSRYSALPIEDEVTYLEIITREASPELRVNHRWIIALAIPTVELALQAIRMATREVSRSQ